MLEYAIAIYTQQESKWHEGIYPMVPGHEIAGKVATVGKECE